MKLIKHFLVAFTLIAGTGYFVSCSNDNMAGDNTAKNNQDPKAVAEEHNDAKFASSNSERDAQFVVDAADINLAEARLGKLASTQGMMKEVRDLGEMMNRDHQKAYDDLSAMAKKKNISVASEVGDKSLKKYNDLADMKGKDFDKMFSDEMVSGHKDAIEKFEKASKESADPDIQTWAANMLPSLRMHLDHAMACQEKIKSMK